MHAKPVDAADPREDTPGHRPPESATDHIWWMLALKFALAMFIVDAVSRWLGMENATTGIIAAGFLVSSPPVETLYTSLWRTVGMLIGAACGALGGWWGLSNDNVVPAIFFLAFGAIVGTIASMRSAMTYAAVIGTVVAAQAATGDKPVLTVTATVAAQLVLGCAVAIGVVWSVEKARAVFKAAA